MRIASIEKSSEPFCNILSHPDQKSRWSCSISEKIVSSNFELQGKLFGIGLQLSMA